MKASRYFLYLVVLILPSLSTTKEFLIYEKISGKGHSKSTYTVDKTDQNYLISIETKDQKTLLEALNPFKLKIYRYTSLKNGDNYEFRLEGDKLLANGIYKGEKMKEQFSIDKKTPWIQEFDFGLLPLLTSAKSSLNFQLINPKNFKIHKMVAKKQGIEKLRINEKTYDAQEIVVTLQGFKSMFWKAQVWYDVKTNDLLRYKSNEGPHTPTTTVTLISKTSQLD
jgi:hypothetical protein